MKIVWSLFKKYHDKENNEKFGTLLNNHNLSREIHGMMPPDFSKLSDDNIIEIFAQGKSHGVFQYLTNNYDEDLSGIEESCERLYKELEEGIKKAEEYKHEKLDPSLEKCELIRSQLYNNDGTPKKSAEKLSSQERENLREEHTKLYNEYYGCKKEHENLTEKPKQALIKGFKIIQEEFQDEEKYPLNKLREICNKFSIIDENSVDRCLGDDLSRVGLVGFYFNDHRKSGFNNTILYNVVMKEATQDSLENKKQCVGRPGRKSGPIISSSYVDSSKNLYIICLGAKARTIICKLVTVFSQPSTFIQPNRSTTDLFGSTTNLCSSFRLTTSTVAPITSFILVAKFSPV